MNAKQNASAKPSEPDKVDAYMQGLKHPLADVVEALRRIILSTDREIGEEVKWNAPTFFYAGEMKPFNPKDPQWIARNMLAWMFTKKRFRLLW